MFSRGESLHHITSKSLCGSFLIVRNAGVPKDIKSRNSGCQEFPGWSAADQQNSARHQRRPWWWNRKSSYCEKRAISSLPEAENRRKIWERLWKCWGNMRKLNWNLLNLLFSPIILGKTSVVTIAYVSKFIFTTFRDQLGGHPDFQLPGLRLPTDQVL